MASNMPPSLLGVKHAIWKNFCSISKRKRDDKIFLVIPLE